MSDDESQFDERQYPAPATKGKLIRGSRRVIVPEEKPEEPKKEEVYDAEKVKTLEKQIELLKLEFEKLKTKDVEDEKEMKELTFNVGGSFTLLPEIGAVVHPLTSTWTKPIYVPVGSISWLKTLDQLRAYGYPLALIDEFLKKSSDVVNRDAMPNESCTPQTVEAFCLWWPDQSKQNQRIKKGIDDLIEDIRNAFKGINPFAPQNDALVREGKEKAKGPPSVISVRVGSLELKDFLRNWTVVAKKVASISKGTEVYECVPPKGYYNTSWIPVEYRKTIEEAYNITRFKYCPDPIEFKKVLEAIGDTDKNKGVVEFNADRRPHITTGLYNIDDNRVTLGDVKSADPVRLYIEKIKMNTKPCLNLVKGEFSLREVCEVNQIMKELYPLGHILLSVEPRRNHSYFVKNPTAWNHFAYNVSKNGKSYPRLYADAPFKLFRDFMIEEYAGDGENADTPSKCLDRFIKNVYRAITVCGIQKDLPKEPSAEYRKWITQIFTLGGKEECPEHLKPKPVQTTSAGVSVIEVPKNIKTYSREEINNMPEAIKRQMYQDLKSYIMGSQFA